MEHIAAPQIDLLAMIEAHCARLGMSKSSFGDQAVGDPRLVDDLRAGRELRRKTANKVLTYITTGAPHKRKAEQGAA